MKIYRIHPDIIDSMTAIYRADYTKIKLYNDTEETIKITSDYGVNVITLTEKEISQLQVIENGVYRRSLGAPRYAPNFTLRGGN